MTRPKAKPPRPIIHGVSYVMPRRLGQVYLDPEKNGRIYEQERDSIDVGWLFFVKIPTKGNSNDI